MILKICRLLCKFDFLSMKTEYRRCFLFLSGQGKLFDNQRVIPMSSYHRCMTNNPFLPLSITLWSTLSMNHRSFSNAPSTKTCPSQIIPHPNVPDIKNSEHALFHVESQTRVRRFPFRLFVKFVHVFFAPSMCVCVCVQFC